MKNTAPNTISVDSDQRRTALSRRSLLKGIAGFALLFFECEIAGASAMFSTSNWRRRVPANTLWTWGGNGSGQLGNNQSTGMVNFPGQIGIRRDWVHVSAGKDHSLAVKTDGTLWGWGANNSGQLGDGTTLSKSSPIQIGSDTNWASVSTAVSHSAAIRTDGTLWTWGANTSYQLGLPGSSTTRSSPVQIGGFTWSKVQTSFSVTVALRSDNTLWAWGGNYSGQLCQNPILVNSSSSPIQIGTLSNWRDVTVGPTHVLALRNDGTLWAWGGNDFGQLGQNNWGGGTNKSSPTQIGSDTNWISIAAGSAHSLAVRSNGTLWAWGVNDSGQLGDSSTDNKSSPIQIGSASNWQKAFAGGNTSAALKSDDTLWTWGDDSYGQLGDRGQWSVLSPTQVGTLLKFTSASFNASHVVAIGRPR